MTDPLLMVTDIGGQPKQKYWTPDGREILAAPNMHITNMGTVRDANFDKGWLPAPPTELKPYCEYCDRWHDTEEEVEKCGRRKKASDKRYLKWAKNKLRKDSADKDEEIEGLKSEISDIKKLLEKLVKEV